MTWPTTFCITCRETADVPPGRADLIRQHFADHGIEPNFIQGVHGRSWGLDTRLWHHRDAEARGALLEGCAAVVAMGRGGISDEGLLEEVWRRVLSPHYLAYRIDPGHIGLCLSHWMCWTLALHMGLEEVLICEDDVSFCGDFRQEFEARYAALPKDWQVWYIGYLERPLRSKQMIGSNLCKFPVAPFGTHAMLIRRSALPVLLDRCVGAYTHVDQLIGERALPHLNWYASWPSIAGQHSADGSWPHAVGW